MTEPAPADAPLYILQLKIRNFMGILEAEVSFGPDDVTQLSGPNGQGKTDALTALWASLLGGHHIPTMPVHAGAERAETEVTLGDEKGRPMFVVRRVYRDGGTSTLEVRGADGVTFKSPQSMLDTFIDVIAFNPAKFADPGFGTEFKNNEARKEIIQELFPLSIDLAAHDAETKKLTDERSEVKKRAKKLEAVVEDAIAGGVPDGPKEDEAPIVTQIAQLDNAASVRAAAAKRNAELKIEVDALDAEIKRMAEEIERKRTRAMQLAEEWAKQGQAAMPPKEDPAPVLRVKLAGVRERNAKRDAAIGDRARAEERAKSLLAERTREKEIDDVLYQRDLVRADAIAAAKFPMKSLTINSEGWLAVKKPDGTVIPFHQESKARRTLAGFVILASKRSRLRNCILPTGNDLDAESMVRLRGLAKQFKLRSIVERIDGVPEAGPVWTFRNGNVVPPAAPGAAS